MIKISKQSGFTFIEVIVLIALTLILLTGLLNIFLWQQRVYSLEMADIQATGSARTVMNNFSNLLSQGVSIEAGRTLNGTLYTTGGSTIVFSIPTIDSNDNIVPATYDYIAFTQDGADLFLVIDADASSKRGDTTKLLSDVVNSFGLTYNNGDVTAATAVDIDILTSVAYRGSSTATAHLTDTIFLRNK